jgi:hypothetical protein
MRKLTDQGKKNLYAWTIDNLKDGERGIQEGWIECAERRGDIGAANHRTKSGDSIYFIIPDDWFEPEYTGEYFHGVADKNG